MVMLGHNDLRAVLCSNQNIMRCYAMSWILGCETDFQKGMSRAQAYPLVGPFIVSPVKALISIVQTIVCLVGVIFLGLLSIPFKTPRDGGLLAGYYTVSGLISFSYSVINILSLGILGYKVERPCQSKQVRPSTFNK